MAEKLLTIDQAAKVLGVSPQTLRNWETLGFVRPHRTKGGHRRYEEASLKYLDNIHSSWVIDHIIALREKTYEQYSKYHDEKMMEPLKDNPFTMEEMQYLSGIFQEYSGIDLPVNVYLELWSMVSMARLVTTSPLLHPTTLQYYTRERAGKYVCECEELIVRSEKVAELSDDDELTADLFKGYNEKVQLVARIANTMKRINKQIASDLLRNASINKQCSVVDLQSVISRTAMEIQANVGSIGSTWAIMPPEINLSSDSVQVGNDLCNLYRYNMHLDYCQDLYHSRLVPHNTILMGYKDDIPANAGYVFAPYCVSQHKDPYGNQQHVYFATKLLREGSKFFATIKLT